VLAARSFAFKSRRWQTSGIPALYHTVVQIFQSSSQPKTCLQFEIRATQKLFLTADSKSVIIKNVSPLGHNPPLPIEEAAIPRVGALDNITYSKWQRTVGAVLFAFKAGDCWRQSQTLEMSEQTVLAHRPFNRYKFHYRSHLTSRQYRLIDPCPTYRNLSSIPSTSWVLPTN